MTSIEQLHRQASELHRAGQLAAAEQLYRQILAGEPEHAPTLHAMGLLTFQQRRFEEALALLQKAVACDPAQAAYHQSLGEVRRGLGQLAHARDCFRQALQRDANLVAAQYNLGLVCEQQQDWAGALAAFAEVVRLKPELAEAHAILGNLLQTLGRLDEAIASFRTATRARPLLMAAHYNLGNALRAAGQNEAAAASYREALRLAPEFAEAHNNLGTVLGTLGDDEAAAAAFALAVRLAPEVAEAHHNLGTLMKKTGKFAEAKTLLSRAVELDPGHAPSHFNLGGVLFELREWDQARLCYLEALRLRPDYAEPHCSLGTLCMAKGDYDLALGHFEQALAIQPGLAEAHFNRGMLLLMHGHFAAGWPQYEWRWQLPSGAKRPTGPQWDGGPLEGRTILLYSEGGLGDAMQFIRYVPLVKARGGRVAVICPRRMIPILSTCRGVDGFSSDADPRPPFDVHASLSSLPGILGTELDTIPARVPYLSAPADLVDDWRKQLGDDGSLRVGIHWQGNPTFGWDPFRSMPLAEFAPLAEIEGVRLISLQKGPGIEQLARAPFAVENLGSRLDLDAAFCDTAAVIKNLDLVVTSDSSVAHLAGALGAPVWVALSFGPEWRWLLKREDSPWYPTMRLFRQPRFGDWPAVFERMAGELERLVAGAA
ncbi:MAG: tetratricopeptide repeat protein [Pirellulales bacterium]